VQAAAPRPLTFPFAARLLEAAGGRLQEVHIERLLDETFNAQVVVDSSAGTPDGGCDKSGQNVPRHRPRQESEL
jgi:bifunctional DNase/RNase